jgi:hypothetical protein
MLAANRGTGFMTRSDPMQQTLYKRIMKTGLTGHNPAKADQGFVLFSPMNDLNQTLLINMAGETVHVWQHDTNVGIYGRLTEQGNLYVGAKIMTNMDLFQIWPAFKGGEIREISPSGEVLWQHVDPGHHHDQRPMPHGGCLYMSLEEVPEDMVPQVQGGHPPPDGKTKMYADVLVEVNAQGERIWEWRAIEHLSLADDDIELSEPRWEWSHGNTIAPIDDERVLVSFRAIHTIGIIEKATGKWLWKYRDPRMGGQHDPQWLPNGNVLVYDNGTQRRHMGVFPHSRVFEINPATNEIVWQYTDAFPFAFYSPQISGAQRLPGGNTLICEGLRGRLFQVTPEGEVVWEYVNPHFDKNIFGFDSNMVFRALFYTPDEVPFV